MIPHRFPFAFVDTAEGGDGVVMRISTGGWLNREGQLAPTLALEMMAQAALVELMPRGGEHAEQAQPPEPSGESWPALGGLDSVRFAETLARRPLCAGDVVKVETSISGRFGAMTKVTSRLERDGEVVVEAALLLVAAR